VIELVLLLWKFDIVDFQLESVYVMVANIQPSMEISRRMDREEAIITCHLCETRGQFFGTCLLRALLQFPSHICLAACCLPTILTPVL